MTASIRSLYSFNRKMYCDPCLRKAVQLAKENGHPAEYARLIDATVCARCGADNGTTDFPLVASKPFCPTCGSLVRNWTYPQWLKLSLVGLLLLLVVALAHGRKYFGAGRNMYIGERLIEQQRYADAMPHLQQTLQVAPGSDKAALLMAKAALLSGNVRAAQAAVKGHDGGRFKKSPEFDEVDQLWSRAVKALSEVEQASKLEQQDGRAADAARLMHEAVLTYPESPDLSFAAEAYDEGTAFERKDYDAFLAIAQKQWKQRPTFGTAAALASALACKYAVSGDVSYQHQSEEMLESSRQLAQGNTEAMRQFDEFSERNRYRLQSREIISKQEYDKRFRMASHRTTR